MTFILDSKLDNDAIEVAELTLCKVLLMNNSLFPWLILVPKINNVVELFDLDAENRRILVEETSQIAGMLKNITSADKINIATLGNIVAQMHIHIIARHKNDAAWPNPVWGAETVEYSKPDLDKMVESISSQIEKISIGSVNKL